MTLKTMHHKAKIPFAIVKEARQQRQLFGRPYFVIGAFYDVSPWTVRDWCEYKTRVSR